MTDSYIVTAFVVLDDLLKVHGYLEDCRAQSSAAEVLTVAVVAAKYFQNAAQTFLTCIMPSTGDDNLHVLPAFPMLEVQKETELYRLLLSDGAPDRSIHRST